MVRDVEIRRVLQRALVEHIREVAEELLHWAEELSKLEALDRELRGEDPASAAEVGFERDTAPPGGVKLS